MLLFIENKGVLKEIFLQSALPDSNRNLSALRQLLRLPENREKEKEL